MLEKFSFSIIKTVFLILITIISSFALKDIRFLLFGLNEITIFSLISLLIMKKNKLIANIFNSIITILYSAQIIVLMFANDFINQIMLSNLASLEALSGHKYLYGLSIIVVLIISFIPISSKKIEFKKLFVLPIFFELLLILIINVKYSPLINYGILINNEYKYVKLLEKIQNIDVDKNYFYRTNVDNYREKDEKIVNKPNVIILYVEGLSKNIIEDKRDIMPNVKKYNNMSLSFDNYYNHTFATFRGIIGQLYSGYQFDNNDRNNLISLADILNENGYYSEFINTEPNNPMYTDYINSFGYKKVTTNKKMLDGINDSMSDKSSYDFIFERAEELSKTNNPFMITMYTFGTHVSFDSVYKTFGNGKNNVLNRFFELDSYFGEFMDKFQNSDLYDNTIIIFTTDHASYVDSDYKKTFKYERKHNGLDEIPFFIYYKGVNAEMIDVNGRNSLDFAPTILDFLDINGSNYFLGNSLFSNENENEFNYIFYDSFNFSLSKDSIISPLNENEFDDISEKIFKYIKFASNRNDFVNSELNN